MNELTSADVERGGACFLVGGQRFRTTGEPVGKGGMGSVYVLERDDGEKIQRCVGKIFRPEYLYQLKTDELSRYEHEATLRQFARIGALHHPHLLPIDASAAMADNHLLIMPIMAETLLAAVARGKLTPRGRLELLIQTLYGLSALHEAGLLHRDLTLRNVLIDHAGAKSYLFDFDLALALDEMVGVTYRQRYQGRVYGSPGFSVPPESLDQSLLDTPIGPRHDIFAIGSALFSLFSDQTPYGPAEDMWGLLFRISEGVVFHGESRIAYPPTVPEVLRPIINRCLERDPAYRYPTVHAVVDELEQSVDKLVERRTFMFEVQSGAAGGPLGREDRLRAVAASKLDPSVGDDQIARVDDAMVRYGYEVQRSLGRVKGHAIFIAAPDAELLRTGQFPDANTYPKIITMIDLTQTPNPQGLVDAWLGRYLPVLRQVRAGVLTALFRAVHDQPTGTLLLFSELVDEPRFGTNLAKHELTLAEAFGLGLVCARQISRLHENGIAHNNVRAESLLLKGARESRLVYPAMVGLVAPSQEPNDAFDDVRNLAGLILGWCRPARVEALEPRLRAKIEDVGAKLASVAYTTTGQSHGIDSVTWLCAEALAALDANFALLRQYGGDLPSYAQLLFSLPLYGRLWDQAKD